MANDLAKQLLVTGTNPNVLAFEHVVRQGETNQTDDAYREIYGGELVNDLSDHPFRHRPHIPLSDGRTTSSSGAYQAQIGTWDDFIRACGPRDFSKESQDLFAVWCMYRRGAIPQLIAGNLARAIELCHEEWTSLPGAAENRHGWNLQAATDLFIQYGGSLSPLPTVERRPAPEQEPAPVEDHSIPVTSVTPPPRKESTMLGGFLGNLLMSVVGSFLNPGTAQQVTSIVTKDGQQSTAAQALLSTLLSAVAAAAGTTPDAMKANDKTAIAATAAVQADPGKLQNVEDAAKAHLDAVAPLIDKLAQMDEALWEAQNKGKQTVSTIAIEEHRAGLWDMTRTLVTFAAVMCSIIVVGIIGAIIYESIWAQKGIDVGLIGLGGPLLMAAIQCWKDVFAYRFDGTKSSQAAAEAQNAIKKYDDETSKGQS